MRVSRLIVVMAVTGGCVADGELRPFTSDGCSLFPDRSILSDADWCSCCFEHDLAYWRGGTADERKVADQRLAECVVEKSGNGVLATAMHGGVRIGGSPYLYTWFRWGYGWPYGRNYEALTPEENSLAADLIQQNIDAPEQLICPI